MIRLFLVDDHSILRASLCSFFSREEDLAVCGEVATGEAALAQVGTAAPDVVLIDVSLPDMSGIDLVVALRERHPDLVLAMLSGHVERSYVQRALAAGAQGYIVKGDAEELLRAVRALGRGERFVSRALGGG